MISDTVYCRWLAPVTTSHTTLTELTEWLPYIQLTSKRLRQFQEQSIVLYFRLTVGVGTELVFPSPHALVSYSPV